MTNLTSPDELLALVLESVRSKEDLDAVYRCMRAFPPSNPPLFTLNSMDTIRNHLTVLHDGRSGMDYLVFKESKNSALEGTEAVFDVAGYIAAFSLPGHITSDRALHRPHTLRQSVMITAPESKEFMDAVEALSCLATYLNQYATEGQARQLSSRTAYGLPAIDAQTHLFVHEQEKNGHPELEFPAYMDPFGRIMGEVRKKSFCYTTDNVVEYAETASATDNRMTDNFLEERFAAESGIFRHGQLVKISVFLRSKRRKPDPRFPTFSRVMEVGLRSLTLVGREAEISLMKLKHEDQRQKLALLSSIPKAVTLPRRRMDTPLGSKEDYVRGKMAKMTLDDNGPPRNG